MITVISCDSGSGSRKPVNVSYSDTHHLKAATIALTTPSIFPYPGNSEDTVLITSNEDSSVLIFRIKDGYNCTWNYDCVAKTQNNQWRSCKILCDNMVDLYPYHELSIRKIQVNGRGSKEIVLEYELEGHHLYGADIMGSGDEGEGGWSMFSSEVEIWNIDDSFELLFSCTPHSENWSKEDKHSRNHFDYYKYDFFIDSSAQITLSNPMKKVKGEIVPDKSRKANADMGKFRHQNNSFVRIDQPMSR